MNGFGRGVDRDRFGRGDGGGLARSISSARIVIRIRADFGLAGGSVIAGRLRAMIRGRRRGSPLLRLGRLAGFSFGRLFGSRLPKLFQLPERS